MLRPWAVSYTHLDVYKRQAYPGTHDNTTVADWLRHAPAKERRKATAYLGLNEEEGLVDGMLRGVLASPAKLAVIPMADWLGLGAAGRINTPSTLGGNNWRRRLKTDCLLYTSRCV